MNDFSLKMKIEFNDYYNFNLTAYQLRIKKIKKKHRKVKWIIPLILAIIFGLTVSQENLAYQEHGVFYIIFIFLFTLLLSFACLFSFFYFLYISLKFILKLILTKFIKIVYKKNIKSDYLLNISELGIEFDNSSISIKVNWDNILKIIENEEALYVYLDKRHAFIFIKKCFGNVDEYLKIKLFIENKSKAESQFITLNKK